MKVFESKAKSIRIGFFRMPVELEIETDNAPEYQRVDVARQLANSISRRTQGRRQVNIVDPRAAEQILRLCRNSAVAGGHTIAVKQFMNGRRFTQRWINFRCDRLNPRKLIWQLFECSWARPS
jgi:hypothetical protein